MGRSKAVVFMLSLAAGLMVGAVAGASTIKGVVEYSFDQKFRLIRADEFVYLIKADHLDSNLESQFERIGSRISVDLPPGAIASAWPLTAGSENVRQNSASIITPDSVKTDGRNLTLTGTVLPSTSEGERFVQIGRNVFHVNLQGASESEKKVLRQQAGRVIVNVPIESVDRVWPVAAGESTREPASVGMIPPADHFQLARGFLSVTGTARYSFDDNLIGVQSGDTFFMISRSALSKLQQEQALNTGNRIAIRVPASSLKMIWSTEN
ncbi:MAG: hypothetical protein COT73_08895 [Bdellovibrio sp. CG10_big_fil_rev_8_21_14_0_10_47_8]|nr:MAG: hypothetical protein COT73_08895 [Bdellovibrio sp. CG10_big_fil_rev_8_21_14_0_10_47_8]